MTPTAQMGHTNPHLSLKAASTKKQAVSYLYAKTGIRGSYVLILLLFFVFNISLPLFAQENPMPPIVNPPNQTPGEQPGAERQDPNSQPDPNDQPDPNGQPAPNDQPDPDNQTPDGNDQNVTPGGNTNEGQDTGGEQPSQDDPNLPPTGEDVPADLEASLLHFTVQLDLSAIEAASQPEQVTITIVPGESTTSAVSVDLSPANNWSAPVNVERKNGKLTFTHSQTPGIAFAISGDPDNGYVLTAKPDDGNTAHGSDVISNADTSVSFTPPQGNVAKPVPINKPGKKLLIKNPSARAYDRRTIKDKKSGDSEISEEEKELLEEAEQRLEENRQNNIYYLIMAIFFLVLVGGMIVLRLKLR